MIVIDYDARTTFSYVMNRMHPGLVGDTRSLALIGATLMAMNA